MPQTHQSRSASERIRTHRQQAGCEKRQQAAAVQRLRHILILITASTATFAADVVIPDTQGVRRGANLFHSFEDFQIATGDTATFTQTQSGAISSIFARVTGTAETRIDGLLRSTVPGASLYFFNPNGVFFGPNATIDIDGSFAVSTADNLQFTDGAKFSATPSSGDSLTSAPLAAFGFLTNAPKKIELSSANLTTKTGAAFLAIGGEININQAPAPDGGFTPPAPIISAPGGQLTLTSVARKGSVSLDGRLTASGPTLRHAPGISLNGATLSTSEEKGGGITIRAPKFTLEQSIINSTTFGEGTGGAIQLNISGPLVLKLASSIGTQTSGRGKAGAVKANVGSAKLVGDSFIGSIATDTTEKGSAAGRVTIRAGQLTVASGGKISASSDGAGRAGAVDIAVTKRLTLDGRGSPLGTIISADTRMTHDAGRGGSGGTIRIRAGELTLTNRASIRASTFGDGKGGSVNVAAKTITIDRQARIETNTSGSGAGGNATVQAEKLTLTGLNTGIFANNDSPDRRTTGGNIAVRIGELSIRDGSLITTRLTGPGRAGDIAVDAHNLFIARGASEFLTGIAADTAGAKGFGGNVRINADRIEVTDGGQISSFTAGAGKGGDVTITAKELTVIGKGKIPSVIGTESQSEGVGGDGGDVTIHVEKLTIRNSGRISASTAGTGAAGDVRVSAGDVFIAEGRNSEGTGILSESGSTDQPGAGGSVWLDADKLTLLSGGRVSALTRGPGNGGDVTVKAREALFDIAGSTHPTGLIAASLSPENGGNGGSIHATFGQLSLVGGTIAATAFGAGAGGSIFVNAANVQLAELASIEAASEGSGSAGSVAVTSASRIELRSGSSITVRAALSDAGSIRLIAPDRITLQNSTILAEAGLNGGDVFIDPQFVILDHSTISANAILGAGGNITLIADTFLSSESAVTASSEKSVQGTIDIQSPDAQLANALTALPGGFLGIEIKLSERCPMRLSSELSSFLLIGRGGLPPAPEDLR